MRDAQKTKSRPSRRGRGVKEEICIPIMTPQTPVDQYRWPFWALVHDNIQKLLVCVKNKIESKSL